jgi:hypothetical protein
MKTKQIGREEVLVSLSNQEIIFLSEAVKMYQDLRLGDIDDPKINRIKKEVGHELHEIWKRQNLS